MYDGMEQVYGPHPLDVISMHVPELVLGRRVKDVLQDCISAVEEVHLKFMD